MILLGALLVSVAFGGGGSPAAVEPPSLATWADLCDRPSHWLGKTVRLRIQFHDRVETWNPYLTRFGPRRFVAVQAWADEQVPWIKEEFDAPAVRVFLKRGEASEWALGEAQQGARFELTVVVREVFLDLPWTEVIEVLPLPERIPEGTVIHASKARELMEQKSWKLAELEIDQACTDGLPAHAREELERLRATCREGLATERRPRSTPRDARRDAPSREL